MYHIRLDYYDCNLKVNQTLFDYDYENKEKVIVAVLQPYLIGSTILFAGVILDATSVRKITVYETERDIKTMKQIADANVGRNIVYVYTKQAVVESNNYSNDITRSIMEDAQNYITEHTQKTVKLVKPKEKPFLLFISHSSADEDIASSLVQMLRTLGFTNKNLFCSSVPGYDIREGEDIYDTLASKFNDYKIFVILLLSRNYYKSAACLNEMGATWVLKAEYSTIVCPGFTIPEIKGAVNPTKMAVILDEPKRVNGRLNQLKDRLISFFELPKVEDDTIWEADRNSFIEAVKSISMATN